MDTPLRRARILADMTQDQLVKKAGVSKGVITSAERGLSISPLSRARLARALGRDIDALFPSPEQETEAAL